jgi:hypothetical protein
VGGGRPRRPGEASTAGKPAGSTKVAPRQSAESPAADDDERGGPSAGTHDHVARASAATTNAAASTTTEPISDTSEHSHTSTGTSTTTTIFFITAGAITIATTSANNDQPAAEAGPYPDTSLQQHPPSSTIGHCLEADARRGPSVSAGTEPTANPRGRYPPRRVIHQPIIDDKIEPASHIGPR